MRCGVCCVTLSVKAVPLYDPPPHSSPISVRGWRLGYYSVLAQVRMGLQRFGLRLQIP